MYVIKIQNGKILTDYLVQGRHPNSRCLQTRKDGLTAGKPMGLMMKRDPLKLRTLDLVGLRAAKVMGATKQDSLKSRPADREHLRSRRHLDLVGLNGERLLNRMGKVELVLKKLECYEKPSEACQQSFLVRRVCCCSSPRTSSMLLTARL